MEIVNALSDDEEITRISGFRWQVETYFQQMDEARNVTVEISNMMFCLVSVC